MSSDNKYCTIIKKEEDMLSDLCTNDVNKLWEYAIVPYVFKDNVNDELKSSTMEAMERITRVSVIRFVKRKDQSDYIEISDGGIFSSHVGRKGGKQELYVTKNENKWPNTMGSAMHELMHALGFYHEHCRYDRNNLLKVRETVTEDIDYKELPKSETICYGPYDLNSIMQYPPSSVMTLRQKTDAKIGQREKLSDGDIKALNSLYPPTLKSDQTLVLNTLNGTTSVDHFIGPVIYNSWNMSQFYGPLGPNWSNWLTLGTTDQLNFELSSVVPDPFDTYPLDLYTTSRPPPEEEPEEEIIGSKRKRTSAVDNEKRKRLKRSNTQ